MKMKLIDLEVDYIGEQRPLTPEEEKVLTDYFAAQKRTKASQLPLRSKSTPKTSGVKTRSASKRTQ